MPRLKQITTKIKSVRSTRRIMGAMKLIAAVRLQKAQAALMAYRPYSDAYRDVVLNVAALSESEDHPLLRVPEEKTNLHVLFFTSDRGLCGSFNSALIRNMQRYVEEQSEVFGSIISRKAGLPRANTTRESMKRIPGSSQRNWLRRSRRSSGSGGAMK